MKKPNILKSDGAEHPSQEDLKVVVREVGGKSGKSGIREDGVSKRKQWSAVLNLAKRLRKLRTETFLLGLAPTRGHWSPRHEHLGQSNGNRRQIERV